MQFDLFELHCPTEDKTLRNCLRAYGILPKYKKAPDAQIKQAIRVNDLLHETVDEIGTNWLNRFLEEFPYPVQKSTIKDWLLGRVSVPLIAIKTLVEINAGKRINEFSHEIHYVCSTTQESAYLPHEFTPDLLYWIGLIMGDGCVTFTHKDKGKRQLEYRIDLVSGNKQFLDETYRPVFKKIFRIWPQQSRQHNGCWFCSKSNKAIRRLWTRVLKLPQGKKSEKATFCHMLSLVEKEEAIPFLAGLIDTDIGKHSKGMGGTFRSEEFVKDLIDYLESIGISSKSSGLHYKDNTYPQYDFRIPKGEIRKLYKVLTSKYPPKRKERLETMSELAGVAKSGQ